MMKKLKIIAVAVYLYAANTAFAVVPGFPKTTVDLGIGGTFSSTTQTSGCVGTGSSAAIKFAPTCGSFGAGTSNFTTTTKFFTEAGNSGASITSQNTTGDVVFQMIRYYDAGAGEYRYPTGRIYVDYVCKYDSTYIAGTCSTGPPVSTTVHLSRLGRAHIDFFQTFTALIGTQIIGPDCVKNGDKVTYSIFDFMSGPYTNRDHYRWTKPGTGWDILYYSYDSSSVTYRANTVNSGVDQLSVSIGDCNSNIRTKIISSPGVVTAPTIVKSYCLATGVTTWPVAFMTNAPAAGVTYSWDIAASGAGFTYASGSATTQGAISVNIGAATSGYILFKASKLVGSGCPNAERVDTIKFGRAVAGTISGPACVTVGQPQTYTVTGVPATTSITWSLPSGMTPSSGTTTTAGSSITVNVTSALNYGSISATGASGTCVGTITGLSNINPIPVLTAVTDVVSGCAARNATISLSAVGSGYDNISWTVFGAPAVTGSTPFSVTMPSTFTGGVVSAVANKGACTSASVPHTIGWNPTGITLGISANKTCLNSGAPDVVTVTTDAGYASYAWNLPTGWSGTSTSNSITYTTNGTAGTVTVTASNGACGSTNPKSLPLTATGAGAITVTNPGVVNGVVTLSVPSGYTSYSWYKNLVDLNVHTNYLLLPVTGTVNNSYCVDVTNSSGCVTRACSNSTSNQSARIANTDETQTTEAATIAVSPNPASKIVQVKASASLVGQSYVVTNMSGQQVAHGILSSDGSIDVSAWSSGMYILKSGNTSVKIQVTQ